MIRTYVVIDRESVYALYNRSKALGAFLLIYLIAELGVTLWVYGTPSLECEGRLAIKMHDS